MSDVTMGIEEDVRHRADEVIRVLGDIGPIRFEWKPMTLPRLADGGVNTVSLQKFGRAIEMAMLCDSRRLSVVNRGSLYPPLGANLLLDCHRELGGGWVEAVLDWQHNGTLVYMSHIDIEQDPRQINPGHMSYIMNKDDHEFVSDVHSAIYPAPGDAVGREQRVRLTTTATNPHTSRDTPCWGLMQGHVKMGPHYHGPPNYHGPPKNLLFQEGDSSVRLLSQEDPYYCSRFSYVAQLDGPTIEKGVALADELMLFMSVVCGAKRQMLIIADEHWRLHRILPDATIHSPGFCEQLTDDPEIMLRWFPAFARYFRNNPETRFLHRWIEINRLREPSTLFRNSFEVLEQLAHMSGLRTHASDARESRGISAFLVGATMDNGLREYVSAQGGLRNLVYRLRNAIVHAEDRDGVYADAHGAGQLEPLANLMRDTCRRGMSGLLSRIASPYGIRFRPGDFLGGKQPEPVDKYLAEPTKEAQDG